MRTPAVFPSPDDGNAGNAEDQQADLAGRRNLRIRFAAGNRENALRR